MSTALSKSLGTQLDRLDDLQKANVSAFSPAMGFAAFIYKRAGIIPSFLTDANPTLDAKRLDEAPMLAAVGYAMAVGLWQSALPDEKHWVKALQRLQKRELFPVDRSSFAFRPLEVLGIALGLSSCKYPDDQQLKWLQDALTELEKAKGGNFWESTLYRVSGEIIGVKGTATAPRLWGELPPVEIALALWAGKFGSSFASFTEDNFAIIDETLLGTCLESEIEAKDLAEAAVLSCSLRDAIRMRLKSAIADTRLLTRSTQDATILVEIICRRFPLFSKHLLKRHNNRQSIEIQDEYDVQDLMHAILQLHFEDVRPEETTPSHGGNAARMDFLLMPEEVVVEVKMTRKNLGQREIVSQLAEDKERYKSHSHCRTLICFVYDPDGHCSKPTALEKDLSETTERMRVVVIVAPKGL